MLVFGSISALGLLFTRYRNLILQVALPRLAYFGVTAAGVTRLHMCFLVPVVPAFLIAAAVGLVI